MIKKDSRKDAEMNFGQNLKYYRNLKGITQEDIGKKLNVNKSLIAQYEGGHLLPSLIRAKEIAEILNVTVDALINDKR